MTKFGQGDFYKNCLVNWLGSISEAEVDVLGELWRASLIAFPPDWICGTK